MPLDKIMSVLSVALVGGFYVDLWAHSHGRVDDTFLTPWHGVLYASAGIIAGVLVYYALRGRRMGRSWRDTLPFGYGLSIIGSALFLVGGILDMAWHEAFGFEEQVEDLLSPTHLVLATSGLFMVSGPVRSAWHRDATSRFPAWVPWVVSLTMLFSILTAFTSYAHPAVDTWPATTTGGDAARSSLLILETHTGAETRLPNSDLGEDVFLPDTFRDGRIVVTGAEGDSGSLWVLQPDGTDPRLIWEGDGPFNHASVSPDGGLIAFSAELDDGAAIFTIPADGGSPLRLTRLDGFAWGPSWSPDGDQIVFALFNDGSQEIYIMGSDGSGARPLADLPGNAGAPEWSPEGDLIAFEMRVDDNLDIYVMSSDGSGVVRLTDHPNLDQSPSWAPDGRSVAFGSTRDGTFDVFSVSVADRQVEKLSDNPGADLGWAGTAWQADGSTLVTNTSSWPTAGADRVNRDVRGVTSMLIQSVLIAGLILLMMRRGRLPVGALTLVLTINGALMTVFSDNYWYVVPAALAGVVGDLVSLRMRAGDTRRQARIVPFVTLAIWYGLYLATVAVTQDGLGWSIHMIAGTPLLAGAVGLLMSFVVFPARDTDPSSA